MMRTVIIGHNSLYRNKNNDPTQQLKVVWGLFGIKEDALVSSILWSFSYSSTIIFNQIILLCKLVKGLSQKLRLDHLLLAHTFKEGE